MRYITLCDGVEVSTIWLGLLELSHMIRDYPVEVGARIILHALSRGINAFDCARECKPYDMIAEALANWEHDVGAPSPVIVDKSSARTYEEMETFIAESLVDLERESIEVYLLYDLRSRADFELRQGAWKYLLEAKQMGLVHVIGISTHTIEGVQVASECSDVDVIEVIFNQSGIGILDGDLEAMTDAISRAKENGKIIVAVKPLAGGLLLKCWREALKFVIEHPLIDCVCLGMLNEREIDIAVNISEGIANNSSVGIALNDKQIVVTEWCTGCGDCISECPEGALYLSDQRVHVQTERCTLCGRCGVACPEMAIFIA